MPSGGQANDAGKTRTLSENERIEIDTALAHSLGKETPVAFAYVHGSFARGERFRDLDLAVYVSGVPDSDFLNYEFHLEEICEKTIRQMGIVVPVDCRILNKAPLGFRYSVIRNGRLIRERDSRSRALFEERTYCLYLDFLPYRRRYMREVYGLS